MDKNYVEKVFRPMPDWFERRDRVPQDYADYTHASHGEPYQPDDSWLLEAEQF